MGKELGGLQVTGTEYMRIWRVKNRERYREITNKATAKWRRNNPEKVKAKHQRELNFRNFGGNRNLVLERDGYQCVECGSVLRLSVDHINRDRSNNAMENLQTLCLPCHGRKDGIAGWSNGQRVRKENKS